MSIVMPFAGDAADARRAVGALLGLERREGDELIVADNVGTVPATPGVIVVAAPAERSPAHARNAGAEYAARDWILFLDADCSPRAGLLDAYFAAPVEPAVGALAGGVVAATDDRTFAARYGSARNFLSPEAHLAHPYRPRAVAANIMVRRAAFDELGGFYEGLRAAEDTDFSWRLQEAGWELEIRPAARVEHHYRATVADLRRQWRGYAAGRAWLSRRYPGFSPEPALLRAARRMCRMGRGGAAAPAAAPPPPRDNRPAYLALDALLALDELAGFALSNRPPRDRNPVPGPGPALVLVADRFPAADASDIHGVRVEAARRPAAFDYGPSRGVRVDYREDDGIGARASALAWLIARHPVRSALDIRTRRPGEPSLSSLAPAALRLARDSTAGRPAPRVQALGDPDAHPAARRLAALAGADLEPGRA